MSPLRGSGWLGRLGFGASGALLLLSVSAAVIASPAASDDRVAAAFDAVRSGDCTKLKELLDGHPELLRALDGDGETLLHAAVLTRRPDTVRAVLSSGAPVDERDSGGYTPLALVALTSGNMELALPLVERGAQLDAEDRWRSTVLDLAEKYRRHEMTGYLLAQVLEARVEQPVPRHDDMTMLHRVARCGLADVIGPLVDAGLPVNGTTTSGWTPLHFAAEQGHAGAVVALLRNDAPIDARAADGSTAYNLATEMGRDEVTAILAASGADTSEPVFPVLEGATFGMRAPLQSAQPLARGIVAARYLHHGTVTFTPDGREAYWAVLDYGPTRARVILQSRVESGRWTRPRLASFSVVGQYDDVPFVSPDGKRLYFISGRSLEAGGKPDRERIWVMERRGSEWGTPRPLPPVVNALEGIHHQVSCDLEGNLYFAASPPGGFGEIDIYCARGKDGDFETPVNLGPTVNGPHGEATPFIAPDGSYLLFTRFQASGWSLFASFRLPDGAWSRPVDLGSSLEFPGKRNIDCPIVTRDGSSLLFTAQVDNTERPYWVSAAFLERLKREQLGAVR